MTTAATRLRAFTALRTALPYIETRLNSERAFITSPEVCEVNSPERYIDRTEAAIGDVQFLLTAAKDLLREREQLLRMVRESCYNNDLSVTRGSGRTTRMLLRGLIALSAGQRVLVVGSTSEQGRYLAADLIRMAELHDIPLSDVGSATAVIGLGIGESRAGFHGVVLFDHTVVGDIATNIVELV